MKPKPNHLVFLILVLVGCCLFSCEPKYDGPVKIAVSKLSPNYENWLLQSDSTLLITSMYGKSIDSALLLLRNHHALLVTGGEDVFPDWYGMISDTARCGEFDHYRDTLEIMLIKKALDLKMPVLGICRGHQILNVTLGGSLIVDIPDDVGTEVSHRCDDYLNCHHHVTVEPGSLLFEIAGLTSGTVNTNHHQAISKLAPDLRVAAFSADGVPESSEWLNPKRKSFLLGVQWHPERMDDYPELSKPIAERFIREAKTYSKR